MTERRMQQIDSIPAVSSASSHVVTARLESSLRNGHLKFGNSGRSVIWSPTKSAQLESAKADNVPRPRVLLADDNPAMLEFVSKMLANDCEVVAAVRDGRAALREYARLRPDVLLLSMSVGDLSGIEVGQQLRDSGYDARIVLLTVEEEPDFVKSALGAGVSAYVVKFRLGTDLLPAIRAALVGKLFVSPTLLYAPE